jgi:predicted PurR-regulated permease PerM
MIPPTERRRRLDERITDLIIRLAILGLLILWSVTIVRPFLPIVTWAVVLTVALYPVFAWLCGVLGGRRGLSALLMTVGSLTIVLGPVAALATNLVETVQLIATAAREGTLHMPSPPASVADWPLIGADVFAAWQWASANVDEVIKQYGRLLIPAAEHVLVAVSVIGLDLLRFVAAVVLSGFLFLPGPTLVRHARQIAARIIAPRGAQFVDMAGATIRNVSRGVVGVAVLQTILAGIVLQVSGIPGAGLLAFAILILCLVQLGPLPVILPAIIWSFSAMATGPAWAFAVILLAVGVLDNILKPILMGRGLATPTVVIFLGVVGGTLSYGMIGLFLGPILLGVLYDLLVIWARFDAAQEPKAGPDV